MILTLDDMGCDEASEEQKDMRLRCTGIGKPFVSAYFCVYLYIRISARAARSGIYNR
jgi:hypothetical protein